MQNVNKIKNILSHLSGVIKNGKDRYQALCPAHDDRKPSLSVTVKNGKILLHCHAGCEVEKILAKMGMKVLDLFLKKRNVGHRIRKSMQHRNTGCNLEGYSEFKKIPLEFLEDLGLRDSKYKGGVSLAIPYMNERGDIICRRFRTKFRGENKFRWEKGAKTMLYGLWKLKEAKEKGYVVLVEGESDCHTLWYHDIPAIGIPGASNWNEKRDAPYLKDFKKIYVVVEPDKGGDVLKQALGKSPLMDRIKAVNLGIHKDPSDMYLSAPNQFREIFQKAFNSAISLASLLFKADREIRKRAWKECKRIAKNKDILGLFRDDIKKMGLVGETKLSKIIYLALTTRLFKDPVCVVIKGQSSTGKSFVPDNVLKFFPSSAYYPLTASSEKTLIYTDESLKHRFIIYYELEGMKGGKGGSQDYLLRSLISEKRIDYEYVEATKGKPFTTKKVSKEGPTGVITTTTKINIHPENETRFLSFTTNDTAQHTGNILSKIAQMESDGSKEEEVDLEGWQAFQTWLGMKIGPVAIPFAPTLSKLVDPGAPRIRRDFKKILGLIKASALLHQKNRRVVKRKSEAAMEDYSTVYDLVAGPISSGVDASVPKHIRETVDTVKKLSRNKKPVSVTELAKELKIHKSTADRRVTTAISKGYLKNSEDKLGSPARIEPDEPMPGDKGVLPDPATLQKAYDAKKRKIRLRKQ